MSVVTSNSAMAMNESVMKRAMSPLTMRTAADARNTIESDMVDYLLVGGFWPEATIAMRINMMTARMP